MTKKEPVKDILIKNFPADLHREAKQYAAFKEWSLKRLYIEAVTKFLREDIVSDPQARNYLRIIMREVRAQRKKEGK